MKILFLASVFSMLLIGHAQAPATQDAPLKVKADTAVPAAKEVVLYKKIDLKTTQINKQVHTQEDVYSLLTTAVKTLNESHALTKSILLKNNSMSDELQESNKMLSQTQLYAQTILKTGNDLREDLKGKNKALVQFDIASEFIEKTFWIPFAIVIIYLLIHIFTLTGERRLNYKQ